MTSSMHNEHAPLEVDEDTIHETEAFMDSTQSLTSSILEQVYAHGRRYHRKSLYENDQYMMPADETEFDRLDLMHHLMQHLLDGRLFTAPLTEQPKNVLDCGTGTGIWALEFGEINPHSNVIGVDLAPNQPALTYPNVFFETDDLEKEWLWEKGYFNFIHSRMLGTSIKDWGRYTEQMFDHAAPGAFIELSEHSLHYPFCDDNSVPDDSILFQWGDSLVAAFERVGVYVRAFSPSFFTSHLEAAGFVDVQVRTYKIPRGRDSGIVRQKLTWRWETGLEAYALMPLTRLLNMPEEEARRICAECYETILAGRQHVAGGRAETVPILKDALMHR
ncbi:S-adenosyl-L-methionine-dependent methyltransferase [Ascodesmis nigricans]|uniref:S-adenosyl-L-methionine-dependent methyltransferase n=1 Tax=Ascodesmis nigricans TaxID=341454 RepID=A0A4S2MK43_9PEZI|nr:S-adenosyl-L-methionine-dependent methyltransferase [Ascodesmis nigricans]